MTTILGSDNFGRPFSIEEGRSSTPPYVYELFNATGGRIASDPMAWRVKDAGKPSEANLRKMIDQYNASLEPGGANDHLAGLFGKDRMTAAGGLIRRNQGRGSEVLARYGKVHEAIGRDDVPRQHALKIALSTLKMNRVFGRIMGGMNHEQAIQFLVNQAGYSRGKVEALLKKNGFDQAETEELMVLALNLRDESSVDEMADDRTLQSIYEKSFTAARLRLDGAIDKAVKLDREIDRLARQGEHYGMADEVLVAEELGRADGEHRDKPRPWAEVKRTIETDLTHESVDESTFEGYTIKKDSNDNYRVTTPKGETWKEVAVNLATAKKWINLDIAEKRSSKRESVDEVTIAKYEVQQRRRDTPVEAHMQTPHLKEAKAKALALSKTDPGTAYVTDQTKMRGGWPKVVARYNGGQETNEAIEESVPGVSKWHMFAGGTSAAEGKHSYQWNTDHGEYHLSPFLRGSRHGGYRLQFANTTGGPQGKGLYLGQGLWIDLGVHSSPNAGVKAAREHDASIAESETLVFGLTEALNIPTNAEHEVRDPRSYGHRDRAAETIMVPALKLAKATIFMPGSMFGNWNKVEVNDLVVWSGPYAQHQNALHVQFRAKGKRKTVGRSEGSHPRLVVYSGWGIDLNPESMFNAPEQDGPVVVQKGRRSAFDKGWDEEMRQRVSDYAKKPVMAVFEAVGPLWGSVSEGLEEATAPWIYVSWQDEPDEKHTSGAKLETHATLWKKNASEADIVKARAYARTLHKGRMHVGDARTKLDQVRAAQAAGKVLGESLEEADDPIERARAGGKLLYPSIDTVPLSTLDKGAKFHYPKSSTVFEKVGDTSIKDDGGRRWKAGRHVAVVPESIDEADDKFDAWMRKGDAVVSRQGLSVHDLPDVSYRDWFDDGMSPARAAAKAIRMAKDESLDEVVPGVDDAMRASMAKDAAAFHARGMSRSDTRIGKVKLTPIGASSAPPDYMTKSNPQTKGKEGDAFQVEYGGRNIGTVKFKSSVWGTVNAKGAKVSSREGWSLRNAISQLLGHALGDAWTSNESCDETAIGKGKNGYVAFYKGKRYEVYGDTILGARETLADALKIPAKKRHEVNITLAEIGGKTVIHRATESLPESSGPHDKLKELFDAARAEKGASPSRAAELTAQIERLVRELSGSKGGYAYLVSPALHHARNKRTTWEAFSRKMVKSTMEGVEALPERAIKTAMVEADLAPSLLEALDDAHDFLDQHGLLEADDPAQRALEMLQSADTELVGGLQDGLDKLSKAVRQAQAGQASMQKKLGVGATTARDQLGAVVKELKAYERLVGQMLKSVEGLARHESVLECSADFDVLVESIPTDTPDFKGLKKLSGRRPLHTNASINRSRAVEMFNAGMTPAQIAKEFGRVFFVTPEGKLGQKYDSYYADGSKETRITVGMHAVDQAIERHKAGGEPDDSDEAMESAETAKRAGIQDPNSSGQGTHPDHAKNPYHDTLVKAGFSYSHTTPVFHGGGNKGETPRLHHTYRLNPKFAVSVYQTNPSDAWVWDGGVGGSGRRQHGKGEAELAKYLKGAKRRHGSASESLEEGFIDLLNGTYLHIEHGIVDEANRQRLLEADGLDEAKKLRDTPWKQKKSRHGYGYESYIDGWLLDVHLGYYNTGWSWSVYDLEGVKVAEGAIPQTPHTDQVSMAKTAAYKAYSSASTRSGNSVKP